MAEEIKDALGASQQTTETTPDQSLKYIEAIKNIKANSVDRTEYDKVLEENRNLLNSLANGETREEKTTEEKVDINELRRDLFTGEHNNLDYTIKALSLRKALIDSGEEDPFVPQGKKIAPTNEDYAAADRVAEALESCVEYADGDNDIFTQELQRIMVDSAPMYRRR